MPKKRRTGGGSDQASPSVSKIVGRVFLAVAGLLLLITLVAGLQIGRGLAGEQTARGNVMDYSVRVGADGNEFYYPVVEFYLPDHTLQRVQLNEGSWPPAYMQGEAVTVAYNPQRPIEARIVSFSSLVLRWTVPLITGGLGLAFLGAAALACQLDG